MATLARADLDRFFRSLAGRIPCPVRLVLTGGGEALLLGGARPTGDLDFGLVVAPKFEKHWTAVERAVGEASAETGIPVQYASDIDRWSSVSIPPRRRRTRLLRRLGRLSVHLLDPTCWAVYKLTRYLDADVADLRVVLRRQRITPHRLANICGESLRTSPRSTQLALFRRQVEHFLRDEGPRIWGPQFTAESAIRTFYRAARIPSR